MGNRARRLRRIRGELNGVAVELAAIRVQLDAVEGEIWGREVRDAYWRWWYEDALCRREKIEAVAEARRRS